MAVAGTSVLSMRRVTLVVRSGLADLRRHLAMLSFAKACSDRYPSDQLSVGKMWSLKKLSLLLPKNFG
jgi:hypothetical protein